ncbi:MAG: C4-type zinc ribbon domain-containing protein [bacterium]
MEKTQIYYLACLAYIDSLLDEYQEEFGDLPGKVKRMKHRSNELNSIVEESEKMLKELRKFVKDSKGTIKELKDKEEKLSKKQFLVRNNKEFDAITKEIEQTRSNHNILIDEIRVSGIKEENMLKTLEQQRLDAKEAEAELKEKATELEKISSEQNEEVKVLYKVRTKYFNKVKKENIKEYQRIRTHSHDAVVRVRKNSCSGCFSSVPPQKIVEIRNNLDTLFHCEQCGRILYPEEIMIDDDILG